MTNNVVSVRGVACSAANPDLVRLLERLLDRAKAGEIQSIIATGFTSDAQRYSIWTLGESNQYEISGAITWLQHEYMSEE